MRILSKSDEDALTMMMIIDQDSVYEMSISLGLSQNGFVSDL